MLLGVRPSITRASKNPGLTGSKEVLNITGKGLLEEVVSMSATVVIGGILVDGTGQKPLENAVVLSKWPWSYLSRLL